MALICPWLGLLKELGPTIWKKIYPTNKGWSIEAEMSHFLDLQKSMETTISNNSQAVVKKKAFSQVNAAYVYPFQVSISIVNVIYHKTNK